MPLDTLAVSTQVRQMGQHLVDRRRADDLLLSLARQVVADQVNDWPALRDRAERSRDRMAVPTGPLDELIPVPPLPVAYTALASDGSEIDPDRHGAGGSYFLVNIGWARIPYGQPGREAELLCETRIGYRDEETFIVDPRNPRRQVPLQDRHLDAQRTVEELRKLADIAEAEAMKHSDVPIVALVDGTLLFSVLEERPKDFLRAHFYSQYALELDRLRAANVAVAAYASRTRGIDVVGLLRADCGTAGQKCEVCRRAEQQGITFPSTCALRGFTDSQILGYSLDRWERSALFRVRSNVHDPYFREHRVYFFLLDTGAEVARVEVPEWVAQDQQKMAWLHATLVDQTTKGAGYPAVLARADDRAVITANDRAILQTLVRQEMARRGVHLRPSAKLGRKQVRAV